MLEIFTVPYQPHPNETHHAPPGPTLAKWIEHRQRRTRTKEVFGDLQVFPWVGERQAGKAANLYTNTARQVDQELRALPYAQRLVQPASGNWPIVQGSELGPGPNPWDPGSVAAYGRQRKNIRRNRGGPRGGGGGGPSNRPYLHPYQPPADTSNKALGPHAEQALHPAQKERAFGDRAGAVARGLGNAALGVAGSSAGGALGYYLGGSVGTVYAGARVGRSLANVVNPWKDRSAYDRRASV